MDATQRQKVRDLLERFDNAMLVSMGEEQGGSFHTRPMAIADIDDDLSVWFLTDESSGKVDEIRNDASVQLVFQDETMFLAVTGVASVSQDRAKLEELWDPEYKAWFPNGKDDPNIALIQVRPVEAEYWDQAGGNRVKYAFEIVKAVATGRRPRMDKDQHGKVGL